MSEHDVWCPASTEDGTDAPPYAVCVCRNLRGARADERARIAREGGTYWDLDRLLADERERIAQAIEARHAGKHLPICVCGYRDAARIARDGGRDA